MRSKAATKSFFVFALSLMLAAWALPAADATAKTVILGGGAIAFEIVGEVNNSAPGVVPATSEIFGYLSKVDGIDQVFTDSDPTHQNESTALITFDTDATTIRVTPHGPFRIIDRDGTTTMYLNNGPSTFSDPSTFRQGTPFQVSSFHQQVIVDTVESIFTVVNTNTVTSSSKFTIGGINYLPNKPGQNLRTVLQAMLSTRDAGSPPPTGFFSGYPVEAVTKEAGEHTEVVRSPKSYFDNLPSNRREEGYPLTDTLMALFNSLMFREISLLSKNNSLLQILGNSGKKHWSLLWFLTSQTSK